MVKGLGAISREAPSPDDVGRAARLREERLPCRPYTLAHRIGPGPCRISHTYFRESIFYTPCSEVGLWPRGLRNGAVLLARPLVVHTKQLDYGLSIIGAIHPPTHPARVGQRRMYRGPPLG